jgi:hypothetical protein
MALNLRLLLNGCPVFRPKSFKQRKHPMAINGTLLPLGRIVATPGALEALARAGQEAELFLERHASGDWGQVDEHDRAENDYNLAHGFRILSSYRTAAGDSLWDNNGGRPVFHVSASSR